MTTHQVYVAQHGFGAISKMAVQIFIGGLTRLDDEGQSTGIYKKRISGPLHLGPEGFDGDVQADRRVHGGPEKALHHYAAENYLRLAERFPDLAAQLVAGSIGENVSGSGWDESRVHIGDIYRLGETRIQVSQPRSPCWKIDHRYASKGVAAYIAESGLTGWYYRVLESGQVADGDPFELLDRYPDAVSLAAFWAVWRQHRPELDALSKLAEAPGLTPAWARKLADRLSWLRSNHGGDK